MIFMGVMLEKWPNKDQEYLIYMFNVRLAASRGSGTGCVAVSRAYPTHLAGYGKMKTGHVGPHILRELIF